MCWTHTDNGSSLPLFPDRSLTTFKARGRFCSHSRPACFEKRAVLDPMTRNPRARRLCWLFVLLAASGRLLQLSHRWPQRQTVRTKRVDARGAIFPISWSRNSLYPGHTRKGEKAVG